VTQNSRFGGGRIYEEKRVPCWDCGSWFDLTIEEQKQYDDQNRGQMLHYCKSCRVQKEERE
jgi:hypothetical protein